MCGHTTRNGALHAGIIDQQPLYCTKSFRVNWKRLRVFTNACSLRAQSLACAIVLHVRSMPYRNP